MTVVSIGFRSLGLMSAPRDLGLMSAPRHSSNEASGTDLGHFHERVCQSFQCSRCEQIITGEWITWRRYDYTRFPPRCLYLSPGPFTDDLWETFHVYPYKNGLWYFFFCRKCKRREPELRQIYINADGKPLTDSEESCYDEELSSDAPIRVFSDFHVF